MVIFKKFVPEATAISFCLCMFSSAVLLESQILAKSAIGRDQATDPSSHSHPGEGYTIRLIPNYPSAKELSRTGWAEEIGFHLCDASKKGMNYQDGLAYALRSSLQIKKTMKYPEELRLKAFALAAKRFCSID